MQCFLKTNLDNNKLIFMIWKNGFCVSGTDLVLLTSRLEHSWDPWRKFTYNSRIPPHYSHTLMVVWSPPAKPSCSATYMLHYIRISCRYVHYVVSMYHCTVHYRYFLFPCWSTAHLLWIKQNETHCGICDKNYFLKSDFLKLLAVVSQQWSNKLSSHAKSMKKFT